MFKRKQTPTPEKLLNKARVHLIHATRVLSTIHTAVDAEHNALAQANTALSLQIANNHLRQTEVLAVAKKADIHIAHLERTLS